MHFSDHGIDLELRLLDRRSGRRRQQRALGREPRDLARVHGTRHHHPHRTAGDPHGDHPRRRHVIAPDSDITISFVRSAGPGGQNVNKVATAAQLRFDLSGTRVLGAAAKARLRTLAGRRVTEDGTLLIIARNHRTQEGNRREALARPGSAHRRRAGRAAATQGDAPDARLQGTPAADQGAHPRRQAPARRGPEPRLSAAPRGVLINVDVDDPCRARSISTRARSSSPPAAAWGLTRSSCWACPRRCTCCARRPVRTRCPASRAAAATIRATGRRCTWTSSSTTSTRRWNGHCARARRSTSRWRRGRSATSPRSAIRSATASAAGVHRPRLRRGGDRLSAVGDCDPAGGRRAASTGAGIARDAAGRGLAVRLVERDDLAAHTSSASTKLIHGGLRYLEQYELRLVREALAERERPARHRAAHHPPAALRAALRAGDAAAVAAAPGTLRLRPPRTAREARRLARAGPAIGAGARRAAGTPDARVRVLGLLGRGQAGWWC